MRPAQLLLASLVLLLFVGIAPRAATATGFSWDHDWDDDWDHEWDHDGDHEWDHDFDLIELLCSCRGFEWDWDFDWDWDRDHDDFGFHDSSSTEHDGEHEYSWTGWFFDEHDGDHDWWFGDHDFDHDFFKWKLFWLYKKYCVPEPGVGLLLASAGLLAAGAATRRRRHA